MAWGWAIGSGSFALFRASLVRALTASAVLAGALTLAGFVWAVQSKQFSIRQLNEGAKQIFDDEEPIGTPQDMLFKKNPHGGPHYH